MPFAYDLHGDLDISALRTALAGLVTRHEALRTTFTDRPEDGKPDDGDLAQVVHPPRAVELTVEAVPDLRGALTAALRAGRGPFDLRRGPLWRARVWRYADRRHLLSFVCHHIVVDDRSSALIERDLAALYAAAVTGSPDALPNLVVQYADHVAGRRESESDLGYWRAQLADLPVVDLPADRPRPVRATQAGATVDVPLAAGARESLDFLAARFGVSPFVVGLAAFAELLAAETGRSGLVIGTPVAGRDHPAVENVVGYFLDTLALRLDTGGRDFADLVTHVRTVLADGLAHQGVAFPEVVRALGVPPSAARHPLFDVLFTLVDTREGPRSWAGLDMHAVPLPAAGAPFDLTVALVRRSAGLTVGLRYASDLFDESRVLGWGRRFGEILISKAELFT
ncbi:non-ribosomal peptide synthase [Amycolatopsis keratiniphila]|uniref:Non-ribosomal peptide synthase n=1 Tax=Amycolatopsis keratiniphila TaxID=129921 RepID=R4SX78_9PSEU|nr:non-ribosomal peptide synthase [Amycolatopsis keratiniphila]